MSEEKRSMVVVEFESQGSANIENWSIDNMTVWQLLIVVEFLRRQIEVEFEAQKARHQIAELEKEMTSRQIIVPGPGGMKLQ